MRFTRPSNLDELTEIDGTVIVPAEDAEFPLEAIQTFTQRLRDNHHLKPEKVLLEKADSGAYYELNLEELLKLCWEYDQYSAAKGFSVSQMDVLRAIQEIKDDRVLTSEITENHWTEDYTKQTIQAALKALIDRGLVKKEGRGVYRYVGPMKLDPETFRPE